MKSLTHPCSYIVLCFTMLQVVSASNKIDSTAAHRQQLLAISIQISSLGYIPMPKEMEETLLANAQYTSHSPLGEGRADGLSPFSSIDKTQQYYSLSQNKFPEIITMQSNLQTINQGIPPFSFREKGLGDEGFDPTLFALSIDPLAYKFPSISPYNAMGNNPVNMVDPDGRQALWNFDHENKTITISTVLYTDDDESYAYAQEAAAFYNNLNGQYQYTVEEGDEEVVYQIKFDIQVKEDPAIYLPNTRQGSTSSIDHLDGTALWDGTSNFFDIVPSNNSPFNEANQKYRDVNGVANANEYGLFVEGDYGNAGLILIATKGAKDEHTGAHELGHALGLQHSNNLMSPSNATLTLSAQQVQDMILFPFQTENVDPKINPDKMVTKTEEGKMPDGFLNGKVEKVKK